MSFHFSFFKTGGAVVPTTSYFPNSPERRSNGGGCLVCPLNAIEKDLHHPKMQPTGPENARVYVLGEAPGQNEDEQGQAFVGKAGTLLREHFPSLREWDESRRWNTLRCRPPSNRNPAPAEVAACRQYIEADIERVRPRVIIATGAVPKDWASLSGPISSWRGRAVPVKIGEHVAWLCPVMHPSYVARTGDFKSPHSQVLRRDIQRAIELANYGQEPPYAASERVTEGVRWYDGSGLDQLMPLRRDLELLAKQPVVGFDYETWPLRPYDPQSQLISVAVGTNDNCVAFPIEHRDVSSTWRREAHDMLAWFLLNSGRKVCHNLVFEMEWTAAKFHPYFLRRTQWGDTQAQAFALQEHDRKMKSLDNVVLECFGFHLKSISNLDRKDMRKHALRDVLEYNALDSKWTYNAYFSQMERMDAADTYEYERLVRTSPTVVLTQRKGVLPNAEEVAKQAGAMRSAIAKHKSDLAGYPEISSFQLKKGEAFNPDSPQHVGEVLHKEFGESAVLTSSGSYSTGAPVLGELDNEFAQKILEYRSVSDNIQFVTQLDPAERKNVVHGDGLVHTNYNLVFAATGRTTSDNPNLQNYPSRKLKHIRNCIHARPGHKFVAADYGSFEARVIAMASKDKNLVKYIWEGYDVHGYWAKRLLEVGGKEFKRFWWPRFGKPDSLKGFLKALRGQVKNSWTFPLFYGASFRKCAKLLNLDEDVTRRTSQEFWKDFFGVKQWQEQLLEFYARHGYVKNLNGGRKRREPMSYNELINSPVQGSASDIVVDAWNRISEKNDLAQFTRPELQAVLNVHDDLTFEVPEEAIPEVVPEIVHMMLDCPFEWTRVVPLEVEVSIGDTWGGLQDYGTWDNSKWAERYR